LYFNPPLGKTKGNITIKRKKGFNLVIIIPVLWRLKIYVDLNKAVNITINYIIT